MAKKLLLICLLFSLGFGAYAGGPWTQQKRHLLLISGVSPVIYSLTSRTESGRLMLPRRVIDISWQQYMEYGITNKLTLVANINLKYVGSSQMLRKESSFNENLAYGRLGGLGNSLIGLKYGITKKKLLFSFSGNVETYALGVQKYLGLRTGYEDWGFIPGIHLGKSFKNNTYFFMEAYYVARTKLSDEWRANAEFGYTFKKPFIMAFNVSLKESLRNREVEDESNFEQTGLYLNNQEYLAWYVKFMYKKSEQFGVVASLSGGIRTERIALTPVISLGIQYKWHPN